MRRRRVSQSWMPWIVTVFVVLMGGSARASRAGDSDPKSLFSIWEPTFTVKMGAGHKDNVGLSRDNPESSPFAHTVVEGFLMRLPVDGTQLLFYITAEDTRFWESRRLDHEDFALAQAEVRRFWKNDWQAALSLEGIYFDQLIDFSITDTNLAALAARGLGTTTRPSVRRELSPEVWLSLEIPITRQLYKDSVDDFWEGGPKLTLGRTYGRQSEISASYVFTFRDYNRAPARDAAGDVVTNSVREVSQQEVQVAWKHYWDTKRRWRSSTRLGYRHSAENVSRYFDYDRYEVSHQLRYKTAVWELTAGARVALYRFPVQAVSDTNPEKRKRNDFRATMRVERQVVKHVRLYAQYEYECTNSNQPLDEYAVNTFGGGVSLEF